MEWTEEKVFELQNSYPEFYTQTRKCGVQKILSG